MVPGLLDVIASSIGLIVPPAVDFIKKKFLNKSNDTVESTLSTLATTKPEVIVPYIEAETARINAKIKYHNRDVVGTLSQWIIDLRGAIRPITVPYSLILFTIDMFFVAFQIPIDNGMRYFLEEVISTWFGCRLQKS